MKTYSLVAQDPAPSGKPEQQSVPFFMRPEFLLLLFGLFMVVVWLPAQRRQKRDQQQMMANLKRGAKVSTSSGIIGSIVDIKDNEDEATLRSGDAKIKVLKSSINRVLGQDETEAK
jgi:preprotein translocase subunit YajC